MNFYAALLALTLTSSAFGKASSGRAPNTLLPTKQIFKNSVSDISGDIFLLTCPGCYLLDDTEFQDNYLNSSHISTKHDGNIDLILPRHPMSTHGYAWDYDLRIPLTFFDPQQKWFRRGTYKNLAVQQDVAPTLANILGIPAPDRAEGRVLTEALQTAKADRPKVIVVFVQDQMGLQYYAAHPQRASYLRGLMKDGANFINAQVAHVDVETAVGHVAVGTGAFARGHHVTSNTVWRPGLWAASGVYSAMLTQNKSSEAFPLTLDAATLADVWLRARDNKPQIFSMVSASRAAISMGGHGSMFSGNKKTSVIYLATKGPDAGQYTTNEDFYTLPPSIKGKSMKSYVETFLNERSGKWFDHELVSKDGNLNVFQSMASPAAVRFEQDLALSALGDLKIGEDEETDLIFINFKASDYCGHHFGYESEECGQVLDQVDLAIKAVTQKVSDLSQGSFVAVLTADHGAAPIPELSGAVRYSRDQLKKHLNERFAAKNGGPEVVPFITSSQLWLNRPALKAAGHNIKDVVTFLKNYEVPMQEPWNYFAKAWLSKGKPAKQKLFFEVISRNDLL